MAIVTNKTKEELNVYIDEMITDLNNKVDIDLSNINPTQNTKNEIISWDMPDYDAGISLTKNVSFTAPSDGWIMVCATTNVNQQNVTFKFTINGTTILDCTMYSYSGVEHGVGRDFFMPISKNSTALLSTSGLPYNYMFYPAKGAN